MLRRLAVLLCLALLPSLASAEVIRYIAPGGTFTGGTITTPLLAPAADNCASVPYSFTGDTNTGVCSSAADTVVVYTGGSRSLVCTAGNCEWYYSYTDASNYQRGALKTSASGIEIAAETAGSGADNLSVTITPTGTGNVLSGAALSETIPQYGLGTQPTTGIGQGQVNYLSILVNGTARWTVDSSGVLQPGGAVPAGDAQDIGYLSGSSSYPVRHLALSRSIQGSKTKALTEGAATAVTQIAVPQTAGSNSADAVVQWTVYASDGTDTQTRRGSTYLAAVNKAGTETCTVGDIGTPVVAVSAGTLTCTTSCITGLSDVVQFALDCTSSLTQTSLNALVRLDMDQPNTVTPQ